jgi:putative nucleotidyltransferase with HDIG domain
MATLFFLCASVPLAGLAALTVSRTTADLEDRARERLRYDARTVGQEALGRLELLSRSLELLGTGVLGHVGDVEALVGQLFVPRPPALAVLPGDNTPIPLVGQLSVPALSREQEQHLNNWGTLIVNDTRNPRLMLLVVRIFSAERRGLAAAVIDERWLFGLDSDDGLPPDAAACVIFTAVATPLCSSGVDPAVATEALARENGANLDVESRGESYLVRTWSLPLKAQYFADSWTIVLMRPQSVVRAPISRFIYDFWLVTILTVLAAAWLSLTQVRRQLRPLEVLTAATSRLAHRNFDESIDIRSGDEFQVLGDSFNSLSTQLQRQFSELEAFNLGTLAAFGRAIDAKSPWTAGHSGRVTAIAVAIAEQMQLPANEIEELRRGGLVHDVGKIATPPTILDKPGRLNPEEERVMRLHTIKGVHILEPIPAFKPLLPIVSQHHERWDGSGYPYGLAAYGIARTARVLAVADVCDAMRSDRPYRAGMPLSRVIEIIISGSGRQFDPWVIDAFVAIAPRLEDIAGWPAAAASGPSTRAVPLPAELALVSGPRGLRVLDDRD